MSELTRIILLLCIGLAAIYGLLIHFSLSAGKGIAPYLVCIALNMAVLLFFWFVATHPGDDPQAGMGLGPFFAICGLVSIVLPIIAIVIFFVRKLMS